MARHKCIELEGEEWLDIEDAENYQVSNFGRVRSVGPRGLLITPQISRQVSRGGGGGERFVLRAYLNRRVSLGWVKFIYIHVEVAKAFLPNKMGEGKVVFKDGDSLNCEAVNLAYWWEAPPVNLERLSSFKGQVHSKLGQSLLAFIHGEDTALNGFITDETPKLRRILQSRFKGVSPDKIDDAVQLATISGLRDIRRGFVATDEHIIPWFNCIARNKLVGILRKESNTISEWGINRNDSEFSRFDLMAATN